jgi:TetR/AcrR family transcriptional regulator, transcriptional repressor for nem operon
MRERQSEILMLAGEMIQTKGYDSFSYNDLSLRLGIRKASIHHHFPKKQELGLAYLKYRFELAKDIENQLRNSKMNSLQKLQAFLDLGVKLIEEKKICPVSSFQADRWNINEEMKGVLTKIEETEMSMLTSILEDGRSSEELFFVGEAKDQASLILSSMKGAILYAQGQGLDFYQRTMNHVVANLQGSPSAPETLRTFGSAKKLIL